MAMNGTLSAAFQQGSGVDPGFMHLTLTLIAIGVITVVTLAVLVQLTDAWRSERLTTAELTYGSVKLGALVMLLLWVIV